MGTYNRHLRFGTSIGGNLAASPFELSGGSLHELDPADESFEFDRDPKADILDLMGAVEVMPVIVSLGVSSDLSKPIWVDAGAQLDTGELMFPSALDSALGEYFGHDMSIGTAVATDPEAEIIDFDAISDKQF